jgi:hypothetical protein
MPSETATRDAWKTQPLPEGRARIAYERAFTAEEHARVIRGLVPLAMEDKWFVFHESPWLFFHRSWTGVCIYALKLRTGGGGDDGESAVSAVDETWVNRAPEEYRETDDAHDVAILSYLVEQLLLGRSVPFPVRRPLDATKAALLVHHVVGRARPNDTD